MPETSPRFIPYGRQSLDDDDISAVLEALGADYLTTGPRVAAFESAFAGATGTKEAVAVCNGTAALHAAYSAAGVREGDEVIVPTLTFAATANAALYLGAKPVFADIDPDTLLVDPHSVEARLSPRTRAIVAVDYAGQACDYAALKVLADERGVPLIADACHALGGAYRGQPVGSLADLSTFSLHPVKPITTGEGGMITTDDPDKARKMRTFRNHGITTDHAQRERAGVWSYDMVELGYNYRLTDIQAALGISQLKKLGRWTARRQELAARYDRWLADLETVKPLAVMPEVSHAYHLYVIRLELERLRVNRGHLFSELRQAGIGVNVHYRPVHLHPYYLEQQGTHVGQCPRAEAAYERILTLPLYPAMTDGDLDRVVETLSRVLSAHAR
jgi:perosamine synthetase